MEEFNFLTEIYKEVYYWLAGVTPGEHTCISHYKNYDKKVWSQIKNKISELENKQELTLYEKEFIRCKYIGDVYRVIRYNSRNKGHVYVTNSYQSCSKSVDAVKNVSIHGERILIQLNAKEDSYAIDIFELLCFMIKYELIKMQDFQKYSFYNLERYECEEEVVVPLIKKNITNVSIINFEKNTIQNLPKDKWYRNTLY